MFKRLVHFFRGHDFYEFMMVQHGVVKKDGDGVSADCKIFICDCGKVSAELKLHPIRRLQNGSAFK